MLERLTLSTSTPETLATLHREAPRVPVALALP
jgi:hypothetical protein